MPIVNIPKGTPNWDEAVNQNFTNLETEKVSLGVDGKISKDVLPDDIGGVPALQEKHTYSELTALITEKKLIPGMQYVLTDYQTIYQQPTTNVIKTMGIEKLVLTAIDTSHFAPECSSLSYPQDIVTYDFSNKICEDNSTPRPGFITWRESTNDTGNYARISAPQDWRTMLWVRYLPDPDYYLVGTTRTPFTIWKTGDAVSAGVLYKMPDLAGYSAGILMGCVDATTDINMDYHFSFVYRGFSSNAALRDNLKVCRKGASDIFLIKSDNYRETPTFSPSAKCIDFLKNNTVKLHDNVFSSSYKVTIGSDCTQNTCSIYNSKLGNGCLNNYLEADRLTMGNECKDNVMWGGSYTNSFDDNCYSNVCGDGFQHNTLGKCCNSNIFYPKFYGNILGYSLRACFFEYQCSYNSIGENCSGLECGYKFENNFIGTFCYLLKFGTYCQKNSLLGNCNDVTFGNIFQNKFVKALWDKNISAITELHTIGFSLDGPVETDRMTIEQAGFKFIYWYYNYSGTIVSTLIP